VDRQRADRQPEGVVQPWSNLNVYRYLEFMERSYLFDFAQPTAFNKRVHPPASSVFPHLAERPVLQRRRRVQERPAT